MLLGSPDRFRPAGYLLDCATISPCSCGCNYFCQRRPGRFASGPFSLDFARHTWRAPATRFETARWRGSESGDVPMKVGVAKETAAGERRVALVPDALGKLTGAGLEVLVEQGAGVGALI